MKATDLLKKQHREVKALFRRAKKADPGERRAIMDEIAEQLEHHMEIEEEMFYPAVREIGTKKAEEMVPEAYEEHHVVKLVLNELPNVDPEHERFEAKMTVLDELIQHHVDEEESEMFKLAQKLGDRRLKDLGAQMEAVPRDSGEMPGSEVSAEDEDDEDYDEDDETGDDVEFTAEMDAVDDVEEEDERETGEDEDETEEATRQPPRGRRGGTRRSA